MCCIFLFKILQEYGIEKSQSTSIISAPPPLGELPGQREIATCNNNEQDNKDNEINAE